MAELLPIKLPFRVISMVIAIAAVGCGPSEKSETQQKIVDVYEGWEAETVLGSCPRYYGFPNCPDVNDYRDEVDGFCEQWPTVPKAELNAMLTRGWTVQSHDAHVVESHRDMADGIRVAITCKGQRYILSRTCVTKVNWLGQETPDPRCEPPKASNPEPVSNAMEVSDEAAEESLDPMSNAVDAIAEPESEPVRSIDAKLIPGVWRAGGDCNGFAAITWQSDGQLFAEGLEGTWRVQGNQLTWSYRNFDMGDDEGAKSNPLKIDTGTIDSIDKAQMVVRWNDMTGYQTFYRCPSK